jgi:hypothetical protein
MRTPSAPPGTTATKAKRRRRGLAVIASVIGLLGAPAVASAHGFYDWSQPGGPAPDGAYIVSISYTPDARTQRRKGRADRRHVHLRVVRRLRRPLRRHRRLLLTDGASRPPSPALGTRPTRCPVRPIAYDRQQPRQGARNGNNQTIDPRATTTGLSVPRRAGGRRCLISRPSRRCGRLTLVSVHGANASTVGYVALGVARAERGSRRAGREVCLRRRRPRAGAFHQLFGG